MAREPFAGSSVGGMQSSRIFFIVTGTAAGLLFGWCVLVAYREWFVGDDFVFLSAAQVPKAWTLWKETFLPFDKRLWWSYRPVTIEVFFRLGFLAFGLHPFGYLLVSLVVRFCSGALVYRLATQLGFERRVAAVTAVLSLCRSPSLLEGFWISAFQHIGTQCLLLLTVSLFVDYAQRGRTGAQVASCVTLLLTLLSNELGATLPLVLLFASLCENGFGVSARGFLRSVFRVVPHFLITAVYLVLRLKLFGPVALEAPALYTPALGWHVMGNYGRYLLLLFDGSLVKLLVAAVLALAAIGSIVAGGKSCRPLLRWLARVDFLCVGWFAAALLPFIGFVFVHPRFAINSEAPACLLFGSFLNVLWTLHERQHARAIEAALICLLMAGVPYGVLWKRANELQGAPNKRLIELLQTSYSNRPRGLCVVLLYGRDGLASAAEAEDFRFLTGNGSLLGVFYRDRRTKLFVQDVRQRLPAGVNERSCIFFALKPGLHVEPAGLDDVAPQPG